MSDAKPGCPFGTGQLPVGLGWWGGSGPFPAEKSGWSKAGNQSDVLPTMRYAEH